jgi:glycosyltransferase involved in cell wall biosynthesis
MKIAHITAGAGHMYCGSCLRDNTLAMALKEAGHDILLIPVYTPTRTDEPAAGLNRVFLGGINVFLQEHVPLFRRIPKRLDRFLDSARLLRLATRRGVSVNPAQLGRLTVSMLQGTSGTQRKEILELVRFLEEVSPEIVSLPNSLLIALAPAIKAALDVPVCCVLQGEDAFLEGLGSLHRREAIGLIREHSASVDAFVAVSRFGADQMAAYLGIERGRIHVVPLGIRFDGYARASLDAEPFTIGYLARVAPEKGLHVLCEAYRRLRLRPGLPPSRLCAAGYLAPEHKGYLADIRRTMYSWGLSTHFQYQGELGRDDKLAFLAGANVFSVPATKADQKGQFLLEAMAAGLPVVQPRRGAFIEIVERTGGGILVEPDDPEALAEGILGLWRDSEMRRNLASAAFDGVRAHYAAARMRDATLDVYRRLQQPPLHSVRGKPYGS